MKTLKYLLTIAIRDKTRQPRNESRSPKIHGKRPSWIAATIGLFGVGLAVTMAFVPANGGFVGGTTVTVNDSPGDQNDPHVSGNLAAYTDNQSTTSSIRYYNFLTAADNAVPSNPGDRDLLSDVSGNRIAFSRIMSDRTACMVFDVTTNTLTQVAPAPGTSRFGTALGGNTVAFVENESGNGDIFVADLPAGLPLNVSASPTVEGNPALAPSGDAVVWERSAGVTMSDIMKSTRSGGVWSSPQVVSATIDNEMNPDTDGTTIVYDSDRVSSIGGSDIYFQPLAGGSETQLEINGLQRNPSISSGIIAFESTGIAPGAKSDLFVYRISSNQVFQLTATPTIGEHLNDVTVLSDGSVRVVWAADESSTNDIDHDIFARTFQLPGGVEVGPPAIVFSSTRDVNLEIYTMSFTGGSVTRLTTNPATDAEPAWSPDGSRIAFSTNRDGNFEIYVMSADGSGQTRLTTNAATDASPTWSPDGTKIAFVSTRNLNVDIYVMNADGSGQTRLTSHPAVDVDPSWSPDGTMIAFASNRDSNFEIYTMSPTGLGQTRVTNHPAADAEPSWAPDGTKVAFASTRSGNGDIYSMNVNGSGLMRLTTETAPDAEPAWSQDGSQIAFTTLRHGIPNSEIYAMNANGTGQTRLTNHPAVDISPDW